MIAGPGAKVFEQFFGKGAFSEKLDIEQIANDQFDGNVSEAQRGAALYNAYCARCHTAGYSAGIAFTQETGSGAFGPSLTDGRSVVQFPDIQDHYDFIVNGKSSSSPTSRTTTTSSSTGRSRPRPTASTASAAAGCRASGRC